MFCMTRQTKIQILSWTKKNVIVIVELTPFLHSNDQPRRKKKNCQNCKLEVNMNKSSNRL